jgi:hypothetical protein
MSELLKRSLFGAPVALVFLVNGLVAQEPPAQCTAEVAPAELATGEAALRVIFTLSESIGSISGVDAVGSGLALAAPEDIPRAEMASPDEAPRPIELGAEANTVTVWLRTADAQAGEFALTLQGEGGTCQARVAVR